jgi:hypothetical protein
MAGDRVHRLCRAANRARKEVLAKNWTPRELEEVCRSPSLLVISKDFDEFSPRADPWLILHFGEGRYGGHHGMEELARTIEAITEAVKAPDAEPGELYGIARGMQSHHPNLGSALSLQPGVLGVSIDIMAAGTYLREVLRERRRVTGRLRPDASWASVMAEPDPERP